MPGIRIFTDGKNYYTQRGIPGAGVGGVNLETGNYTTGAVDNGKLVTFDASGNAVLTLPPVPPSAQWTISVEDFGAAQLSINPNGVQLDGSLYPLVINGQAPVSTPQFVRNYGFNDPGTGTATTVTLTNVTMTVGNVAIIFLTTNTNAVSFSSVTDSVGNLYKQVPNTYQSNASLGTGYTLAGIWYAPIVTGGTGITITATLSASNANGFPVILGAEFSGLNVLNPVLISTGQTGSSTAPTTPSITTSIPNCLLCAAFFVNGTSTTPFAGTGWTNLPVTNVTDQTYRIFEYQITSATGTFTGTMTNSGSTQFDSTIVAFQGVGPNVTAPVGDAYVVGTQDFINLPNSVANPAVYYGPDVQPAAAGTLDDEFSGSSLSLTRWTWVNQQNAVATVSKSVLYLNQAAQANGWSYVYQPAPATPWTVILKCIATYFSNNNFYAGGIMLSDSTGKLVTWTLQLASSAFQLLVQWYNSPTSFNSTKLDNSTAQSNALGAAPFWLSVQDDGTNAHFSVSMDGINYLTLYSESRTAFLTAGATRIGIGIDMSGAFGALSSDYFRRTQ